MEVEDDAVAAAWPVLEESLEVVEAFVVSKFQSPKLSSAALNQAHDLIAR